MRVNNVFSGRPAYYDRGPVQKVFVVGATLAPAALADQTTYTVPSNRKALCESTSARLLRATVATTAGLAQSAISITPSGSGENFAGAAAINSNGVGDRDGSSNVFVGTLLAGDKIGLATSDGSTAGTVTFLLGMKLLEYDA